MGKLSTFFYKHEMRSTLVTASIGSKEDSNQAYLQLDAEVLNLFTNKPLNVKCEEETEFRIDASQIKTLTSQLEEMVCSFQAYSNDPKQWVRNSALRNIVHLNKTEDILSTLLRIEQNRASFDDLIKQTQKIGGFDSVKEAIETWKREWSETLKELGEQPNLMLLPIDQEFTRSLDGLLNGSEEIRAELERSLEAIKMKTPRLYLLTDQQVLNLLKLSHEPERLANSPLLSQMFSGVTRLILTKDEEIQSVESKCGEKINLGVPVKTKDGSLTQILNKLCIQLSQGVKQDAENALLKLQTFPIAGAISEHSFQAAMHADQVLYAFDVEEALKANNLTSLKKKYLSKLNAIVERVRGKLTPRQRGIFESLAIHTIHQKDVVTYLLQNGDTSSDNMNWQLQPRLYQLPSGEAVLRVGVGCIPCGFEYMGYEDRLVVTPLTVRSYITMANALALHKGCSVEGLCGSGKGETVKNLAKLVRRHAVYVNCSSELGGSELIKLLKGASSEGSWMVMDELNRTTFDNLKILGLHLAQVHSALATGQHSLQFLGTPFSVVPSFGFFSVINPGYLGRAPFPDNLANELRSLSVMVPDYALIAEIKFYAQGFINAKFLAESLVRIFKGAAQTLSKQKHYDYGLRQFMTTIRIAGCQKRADPELPEEEFLLLRALSHVIAILVPSDVPLFKMVIKSQFPWFKASQLRNDSELEAKIAQEYMKMGIKPTPAQVVATTELRKLLDHRHSVMCLGAPLSGKTSAIQAAANLMGNVDITRIATKDIPAEEFYGLFDGDQNWKDGVFSQKLRELIQDEKSSMKWIVLDGHLDPQLTESLCCVADSNKALFLSNGEALKLKPNMRIILETNTLDTVTPAFVSRSGVIYFSEKNLKWTDMYSSFLGKFSGKEQKELQAAKESIRLVFEKMSGLKTVVPLTLNQLMQSFLRLLKAQLKEGTSLSTSVLFALIWSLGAALSSESRIIFNDLVKSLPIAQQAEFPHEEFVFDVGLKKEVGSEKWVKWEDLASIESSELVPTSQTVRQMHLMSLMAANSVPFILVGPTATGKTASAAALLAELSSSMHTAQFSCKKDTTHSQMRKLLKETKEKAEDKGSLVFLDNINITERDKYGTTPALQVLFEYLQKGETNVMCAMNPEVKGSQPVSPRLFSHCNVISFADYSECSLEKILPALCSHPKIVSSTIELYREAKLSFSGESWNLRDLKRITRRVGEVQGVEKDLARVWAHQAYHVLGDRLTEIKKERLSKVVSQISEGVLGAPISPEQVQKLIWCDLGPKDQSTTPIFYSSYEEIREEVISKLKETNQNRQTPLNLVAHEDNIRHLVSLLRALRHQRGNTLLLTSQVSDVKSLASLAFSISGVREVKSGSGFNSAFKQAVRMAGKEQLETGLVITPEMTKDKTILQEIESFLSTGGDQLKKKLHFVVIVNPSEDREYLSYPGILESTFIDLFEGLTEESLKWIAKEGLSGLNLSQAQEEEIVKASLQIKRMSEEESQGKMKEENQAKLEEMVNRFKTDYRGREAQFDKTLAVLRSTASSLQNLKKRKEELKLEAIPQSLAKPLSSGVAIRKRVSKLEEQKKMLSRFSLRRAALSVFGQKIEGSLEKIVPATEEENENCEAEGMEAALFNTLLMLMCTPLMSRMNYADFQLQDLRKQQRKLENKLGKGGNSVNTLLQNQLVQDLNSMEQLVAQIEASELKKNELTKEIKEVKTCFTPIIERAKEIFECLKKINTLDPLYNFTFVQFQKLFNQCLITSAKELGTEDRLCFIQETLLKKVHAWVSRGLREEHRLLFSLMLAVSLSGSSLESEEMNYLFYYYSPTEAQSSPLDWMSDQAWTQVCNLSTLPSFNGLSQSFRDNGSAWLKIFEKDQPHEYKLPGVWRQRLNEFQFLLILRAVQPAKLGAAIHDYVANMLGSDIIGNMNSSISDFYQHSSAHSPLLVITEREVSSQIKRLVSAKRKKLLSFQMGSHQSNQFESQITEASKEGTWVLLNNSHLLCEKQARSLQSLKFLEHPHRNFRLWITTSEAGNLSQPLLDCSTKFFAPKLKSLKEVLLESLESPVFSNPGVFNGASERLKRIIVSILFLGASLSQRKKYELDAARIPHLHRKSNLEDTIKVALRMEKKGKKIQIPFIGYMLAEVIFGGKVHDDKDRRLLHTLTSLGLPENLMEGPLRVLGQFSPPISTLSVLREYIQSMPDIDHANLFGFSEEVEQAYQEKKNEELLRKFAELMRPDQPRTREAIKVASQILNSIPDKIVPPGSPKEGEEQFHQVLVLEAQQYNRFYERVETVLRKIVGCEEASKLEREVTVIMESLGLGQMPQTWKHQRLPSQLGLFEYFEFMKQGAIFFANWSITGLPSVFTLSYFYNPQNLLQAVTQRFALNHQKSMSNVKLSYNVAVQPQSGLEHSEYEVVEREGSIKVDGLYLARGHWDDSRAVIVGTTQGMQFSHFPAIEVAPTLQLKQTQSLQCPVYKAVIERGTAVGRPNNFITFMSLPIEEDEKALVAKGVALLTQPPI